ncbi:MAG: GntR family transcriptional regulator [Clostridia bacterium]|nr:GntR family transcriptional regulator [Clostridia bacterium]
MGFNFKNDTPIYLQIIEEIKKLIITGKYLPEQKLPSVRDFSASFCVNPNTVQKALLELESDGLIYTERTSGKFVTNDLTVIENAKNEAIVKLTLNFLNEAQTLGITKQIIIDIIESESDL